MQTNKIPLLVIVGPTASGKTALSVKLAKLYNGEIVSADSMQIYIGMDIATAKPDDKEKEGIPHHLMNFVNPDEPFSVADYVEKARLVIDDIFSRGKLPILVGGTGLYVNSIVDNVKFDDTCASTEIRERLSGEAKEFGNQYLLNKLKEVDPVLASELHENNLTRIIRALEVFEITGIPLSKHKENSRLEESPYKLCMIGLNFKDRAKLYERINRRVDLMVESGLIEEAKDYQKNALKTSAQAIGYKELIPYLNGLEEASACIEKIKLETRHYAKRQLTWFRRDDRINWIYLDELEDSQKIIECAQNIIEKSAII